MKTIVIVFGLLVSSVAFGNGLAEMNKTERCGAWVSNAMHGATQAMRGTSREVQFIPRNILGEMLAHSGGVTRDKIYILTEDGYTQEERDFIETSTLFGYDAMSSWKSRNANKGPNRQEWQQNLMAMCVEKEAI